MKKSIKEVTKNLTDPERLAALVLERREKEIIALAKEVGIKRAAQHYRRDPEEFADYLTELINKHEETDLDKFKDPDF